MNEANVIQMLPAPEGMQAVYTGEHGEKMTCPVMLALYRWPTGETEVRVLAIANGETLTFDVAQAENFSHFAMGKQSLPTMIAATNPDDAPTMHPPAKEPPAVPESDPERQALKKAIHQCFQDYRTRTGR